jgi:hypothetical protein
MRSHVTRSPDRIRLGAGRHDSPADGACVVELASVLANEPFSDQPECVCPVIAAFLRGWNDRSAYSERERMLRPYAARIVGTRASAVVTTWRRDLCLAWVGVGMEGGRLRRLWKRLAIRPRIALYCGLRHALKLEEGAPEYAARVLYGRRDTKGALGLLEALLAATGNGAVRVGAVVAPLVEGAATPPHDGRPLERV